MSGEKRPHSNSGAPSGISDTVSTLGAEPLPPTRVIMAKKKGGEKGKTGVKRGKAEGLSRALALYAYSSFINVRPCVFYHHRSHNLYY